VVGLFHSPLAGDTGKIEENTRATKEELLNLRADSWDRERHLFDKLDDWRNVSQEALGNIYSRMGEMWSSVNELRDSVKVDLLLSVNNLNGHLTSWSYDQRSGTSAVVDAIRSLASTTLQVNVANVGDFSAALRAQGVTGV